MYTYNGARKTLKTAVISIDGASTGTVVAAVTGKKIRVIYASWQLTSSSSTCQFFSDVTAISHILRSSNIASSLPVGYWWFETAAGEPLKLQNSAGLEAQRLTGTVNYLEI